MEIGVKFRAMMHETETAILRGENFESVKQRIEAELGLTDMAADFGDSRA